MITSTAQPDVEIQIRGGICKIYDGPARQVRYSTEEAVGLALLKMNRDNQRIPLTWNDLLGSHGVAMGVHDHKVLTLAVLPPKPRDIYYQRAQGARTNLKATYPTCLLLINMEANRLRKASLWLVKPGTEKTLRVEDTTGVLRHFPYGNVYGHGGICWGTTPITDCRTIQDVEDTFFSSGFNGDLWEPAAFGSQENIIDYMTAHQGIMDLPPVTTFTVSVASAIQTLVR